MASLEEKLVRFLEDDRHRAEWREYLRMRTQGETHQEVTDLLRGHGALLRMPKCDHCGAMIDPEVSMVVTSDIKLRAPLLFCGNLCADSHMILDGVRTRRI